MPSSIRISIPTTSVALQPKPHVLYEVSVSLPLRTYSLPKRYSDFVLLRNQLASHIGEVPPVAFPPKTFFRSGVNDPALTETRRSGLETYLQHINGSSDGKWSESPVWRAFLNIPSNISTSADRVPSPTGPTRNPASTSLNDPVAWLETYRELKSCLRELRLCVSARDRATTTTAEHDDITIVQKTLARASTTLSQLERSLKLKQDEWGNEKLGEGEVRRRRDLLAASVQEKDDLERLLGLMAQNMRREGGSGPRGAAAVAAQSDATPGPWKSQQGVGKGRVLGKETQRTRELNNKGLLELQMQMTQEQDEDVELLGKAVQRQRELALQINEELGVQNGMLNLLDEDVDRVEGKVEVARKRVDKID